MICIYGLDDYFDWLVRKVTNVKPSKDDLGLLAELYFTPFKFVIPNDSHRRDDGLGLRDLYEYETSSRMDWDRPCSVLEVLVSIASYVAEDVIGTHHNAQRTVEWFWMMLDNLGLKDVGDVKDPLIKNYIHGVIDAWLNRDFEFDGTGSPFPIKRPVEDQRKNEIWKQICTYIVDNPWLEK